MHRSGLYLNTLIIISDQTELDNRKYRLVLPVFLFIVDSNLNSVRALAGQT
jgi:hypothetical protein